MATQAAIEHGRTDQALSRRAGAQRPVDRGPCGSIYGFLGPNGAGKTTALKMLAGLTRPTRGTAAVAGIPVEAGPAYRQAVGYLGQEPRFYGWMSGRETIEYVGSLYPARGAPERRARPGGPGPRRHRRCGRPADEDLLRRHASATGHRPGARRPPGGPAPRRAGQRARSDRSARGARADGTDQGRSHRLLLDPHPRRRAARERPRRDPRPRPARPSAADGRASRQLHPRPDARRPRFRDR